MTLLIAKKKLVRPFRSYRRYRQGRFRYHTGGGFTPPQLAQTYNFPANLDGTGFKIGILELGGGFVQADLDTYLSGLGLKSVKPNIVLLDGASNSPSDPNGADGEVMLDVCIAAAMANGAMINLYFAPNSTTGFADCYKKALEDGCDVLSSSWGGPEDQWSGSDISAMESALAACVNAGMILPCAAGDNGSGDGEPGAHVDYPGSSIYALCCGGTSNPGQNEVVWNDGSAGGATGGGISSLFPVPAYQKQVSLPSPGTNRCVPDVAGNADPATGWLVRVDGQDMVIGGTSAVSPMWAALIARLFQGIGKRQALHQLIYSLCGPSSAFRDITSGNNGTYIAGKSYDLCTGCGVPVGSGLLAAAISTPIPAPSPPTPTPIPPQPPQPPLPAAEIAFANNMHGGTYIAFPLLGSLAGILPSWLGFTLDQSIKQGIYQLTKE